MVWQDKVIEERKLAPGKMEKKLFIPQRTQPPHIGHISMLEAACDTAEEVVIGIGSANVVNKSNPYYSIEREMMLRKSLEDKGITNYRFVHMPDFNDDMDWLNYIMDNTGFDKNTKIVSGNDWVENVFGERGYSTLRPEKIIKHDLIDISATKLRNMIINDDQNWKNYAATGTLEYFEKLGGKERISKFYN